MLDYAVYIYVADEDNCLTLLDDTDENKKEKRKPAIDKPKFSTKPSTSTSNNPATSKTNSVVKRNKDSSRAEDRHKRQKVNPTANKPQKPFNRLLEGVVLVISGYQNPLRGELRNKAMSMGSKYKADWDNNCTHLM